MKETTKLILADLEIVNEWFKENLKPFDSLEDNVIEVHYGHTSVELVGMWRLTLNLEEQEYYLTKYYYNSVEKRMVFVDYRLTYTDFEKEHFDEELYKDFLIKAQSILVNWAYTKERILNKYDKLKTIANNTTKVLTDFQA